MNTKAKEAMKLALEALDLAMQNISPWHGSAQIESAYIALRQAITETVVAEQHKKQEQSAQHMGEPVVWVDALFDELKHGDEEHQLWLHEKLKSWALKNRKQEQGEPVAWLYPEGLEALQAGKCWTAYPTKHESCTIPLSLCTPQQRKPLTADDLKEPKNGNEWRVEWWNESCRMMLPSNKRLDCFTSYKNGTLQFTIKEAAHGIQSGTDVKE